MKKRTKLITSLANHTHTLPLVYSALSFSLKGVAYQSNICLMTWCSLVTEDLEFEDEFAIANRCTRWEALTVKRSTIKTIND